MRLVSNFPGHTEFFAHLAGEHLGYAVTPVMMLAGPLLRAVPVTIHIALNKVPAVLDTATILTVCRITALALKDQFGIANPRLAIAGLTRMRAKAAVWVWKTKSSSVPQ